MATDELDSFVVFELLGGGVGGGALTYTPLLLPHTGRGGGERCWKE